MLTLSLFYYTNLTRPGRNKEDESGNGCIDVIVTGRRMRRTAEVLWHHRL
jgi:hypothetical protein